jgi:hypothetical protein
MSRVRFSTRQSMNDYKVRTKPRGVVRDNNDSDVPVGVVFFISKLMATKVMTVSSCEWLSMDR